MRYERMNTLIKTRIKKPYAGVSAGVLPYVLALVCLTAGPVLVSAQVSSNEINYFSRCRNITDERARVNCYDELYDRAVRAVTPRNDNNSLLDENRRMREELARIRENKGSAAASDQYGSYSRRETYPASNTPREYSRSTPYPESDRAEEFGLNESSPASGRAGQFGKNEPQVVVNDKGKEELIGRVTSLDKGPNGWIITLEHGQVWRQMISKRFQLREGQEVRIYPTMWGKSFRLTLVDGAGFIQVERIR